MEVCAARELVVDHLERRARGRELDLGGGARGGRVRSAVADRREVTRERREQRIAADERTTIVFSSLIDMPVETIVDPVASVELVDEHELRVLQAGVLALHEVHVEPRRAQTQRDRVALLLGGVHRDL